MILIHFIYFLILYHNRKKPLCQKNEYIRHWRTKSDSDALLTSLLKNTKTAVSWGIQPQNGVYYFNSFVSLFLKPPPNMLKDNY